MIRPIKTDSECDAALQRIDKLWNAKDNTPEGDELEVLLTLVEAFEAQHHPMPPPTPIEAIKFRMEQMGMARSQLSKLLGSKSRVSEILSGKRKLTVRMMKILHRELGVPAEVLLGD